MERKDNAGMQYKRMKTIPFSFADFVKAGAAAFLVMAGLPPKARVVGGAVTITEAFNSTTSDTGTVGDSTSTGRFKTGINMQALGVTALVPTGDTVDLLTDSAFGMKWTPGDGVPTTGKGFLDVEFVVTGCADEYVN
jgi:hypothetical protein